VPATNLETPRQLAGVWYVLGSTHDYWRLKRHVSLAFEPEGELLRSQVRYIARSLFGPPTVREFRGVDRPTSPGSFSWEPESTLSSAAAWKVAFIDVEHGICVVEYTRHKVAPGTAVEIFARAPVVDQATIDEVVGRIRERPTLLEHARGMAAVEHDHRPPRPYRFRF
jgi:hypothetical protein